MRDDERDGTGRDLPEIESGLAHLAPANVPPGLRGRVIDRALKVRRNAALTPRLRTLAVVCALGIGAVLVIDPLVARHETARLAAVLDGRSPAGLAERPVPELTEALTEDRGVNRLARLQALAASAARADRPTNLIETREWLKGWLNNENLENPD